MGDHMLPDCAPRPVDGVLQHLGGAWFGDRSDIQIRAGTLVRAPD